MRGIVLEFRWNGWNIEHVQKHGVTPEEAESLAQNAQRPYPRWESGDKWVVIGRGTGGRFIQVIYILDDDDCAYIIHARSLNPAEKSRHLRRTR